MYGIVINSRDKELEFKYVGNFQKNKNRILFCVNLNFTGDKNINWELLSNSDKRFENNYLTTELLEILIEIKKISSVKQRYYLVSLNSDLQPVAYNAFNVQDENRVLGTSELQSSKIGFPL